MMPSPAVTLPPGEFTYRLMSALASSLARNNNWATMRLAISSEIGPPRKMIRSLSSRE
jgi:hypothetical protein